MPLNAARIYTVIIIAAKFFTVAMIVIMSTLLTMTMAKAEGKRKAKNRLIVQSKFPLHTLKNKTRVEVAIPLSGFLYLVYWN